MNQLAKAIVDIATGEAEENEPKLRVTPAMAAGVTDRLWSIEDIALLMD